MKKYLLLIPAFFGVFFLAGCSDGSNTQEAKQVNQQQAVYVNNQPSPTFDWSLERHIMVELYKARNDAVQTYSYVRNFQGQVIFSCKSIGFPLPANDQLTNSEAIARDGDGMYIGSSPVALPQAEPNGLYSSPSTSGTYVFCVNSDGTVSPSYFEANVETHLSQLNSTSSGLSGDGVLKIDVKK